MHVCATESVSRPAALRSPLGSTDHGSVAADCLGLYVRKGFRGFKACNSTVGSEGSIMAAALICVISVAVFLQFFVSYCRSILAVSRKVELSDRVREVSGIANRSVGAEDFSKLVQLVRLCPEQGDERRVGKECRSRWSPYH